MVGVALGLWGEKGERPVGGSSMKDGDHGGTCTIMPWWWWLSSPTIFVG